MTIESLQNLLGQYKLRPDKKFGQNFLLDDEVLDAMVEVAQIGLQDTVIEVGPGIGNLTSKLAVRAGTVLAIEKDERLQPLLKDLSLRYKNVDVRFSDVLHFDFLDAMSRSGGGLVEPPVYKVVANIPYYVTGKIVQVFLRSPVRPRSITVLVQKEVAENMVAEPGSMNLLALSVQLIGTPSLVRKVPANSFFPAPKVDSAVVHIDIPLIPLYGDVDEKAFFRVARACFAGKRKQIHNTLVSNLGLAPEIVDVVLNSVGIDRTTRPQELSVATFLSLANMLKSQGLL